MITVVNDVQLLPYIDKYDAVLIGTNLYCTLSQGAQRDVALHYPYVRRMNMRTKYGDTNKLGTILECQEGDSPVITLLYICNGYNNRKNKGEAIDYLSYESLETCLRKVNILYKNKILACPLLGCSRFDGNGDRDRVMDIINRCITDLDLTVYDYFQKTRVEKLKEIRQAELKVKEKDYKAYHEMVKKRKAEADELFKLNGFARY